MNSSTTARIVSGFTGLRALFSVSLLVLTLYGCSTLQPEVQVVEDSKPVAESVESNVKAVAALPSGFGGTGRTHEQSAAKIITAAINPATLRHSEALDSGFGGTGKTASGFGGTGLVGTLEQFGSIWINGVEVGIGKKTLITSNLGGSTTGLDVTDLRIGQQIWLETHLNEDKTTTAEVHVFYPLAGQINAVKKQGDATEIIVNGQRVLIYPQTVAPDTLKLQVGERVRISGVPVYSKESAERSNVWHATLIEHHESGDTWFCSVPDIMFSDQVNRVLMHPSWSKAYEQGEFKGIKPGLSAQPKIKVLGSDNGNSSADVIPSRQEQ